MVLRAKQPSGGGIYEVYPGLFQTMQPETTQDWDRLFQLADAVVSVGGEYFELKPDVPVGKMHMQWIFDDGPVPNEEILNGALALVLTLLGNGKKVVVHCAAGANRSGLLNALAIRHLRKVTGADAASIVRLEKPGALINPQFNRYLQMLGAPGG